MIKKPTNVRIILDVLMREFERSQYNEKEREIRKELLDHGLGPYDQDLVDMLRRFKDFIQKEMLPGRYSGYYVAKGAGGGWAVRDWDKRRMVADSRAAFPAIEPAEIGRFVRDAVSVNMHFLL